MENLDIHLNRKACWCGGFNAHSSLWGTNNDHNETVIQKLMDNVNFICLNAGRGTRVNMRTGMKSVTDHTIWQVVKDKTLGIDHYHIITEKMWVLKSLTQVVFRNGVSVVKIGKHLGFLQTRNWMKLIGIRKLLI